MKAPQAPGIGPLLALEGREGGEMDAGVGGSVEQKT